MTLLRSLLLGVLLPAVAFATPLSAAEGKSRILVLGDSLLAAHSVSGRSVSGRLSRYLGQPIRDHSVAGARMIYNLPITGAMGMSIPKQWRPGGYDWVILNGGGNDLWLGCGCKACDHKMERLISGDGRKGTIPGLVSRIRKSGARVIIVGYLRSPGFSSPIESCKDEGDTLEARLANLAALDRGIIFHSIADMVPHGDLSYHAMDRIHPSLKASDAIARRLAQIIQAEAPHASRPAKAPAKRH